jgi:hypothetical protein
MEEFLRSSKLLYLEPLPETLAETLGPNANKADYENIKILMTRIADGLFAHTPELKRQMDNAFKAKSSRDLKKLVQLRESLGKQHEAHLRTKQLIDAEWEKYQASIQTTLANF